MFDLIDNKTKLLGDNLREELKRGSTMKIVASYFSIYAYEHLKNELDSVEELQFIFPTPLFTETNISDKLKKEKKEFFIPKFTNEKALCGTEFEIKLRNQLTQKKIAFECSNWIKEKVTFKSNKTQTGLQNFMSVDTLNDKTVYHPVNAFTSVDLGYEKDNMLYQAITKSKEESFTNFFFNQFNNIWNDEEKMEDVTESVIDYISSAYVDNSPEYIYFLTLYNVFSEFLTDIMSEDFLPSDSKGYKETLIWEKLYNFQKDGSIAVINKLEKYNGCILADSVGLGKTFTALGVMNYYSKRNKDILVLCPKKLSNNWNKYRDNVRTNIFYKDKIRFDVLYHTDLGRKKGISNGHDLSVFNWDNYDLVVIDESHNFRNANSYKEKESRYDFLKHKVLNNGRTKVLMLSATPVNNGFLDLKNQLSLAYGEFKDEFNSKLDTEKTVDVILKNAQQSFNEWSRLPKDERKSKDLLSLIDMDFSILLDNVTIARSRKHITKYYDSKDIGEFPKRFKPVSYYCDLGKKEHILDYNDIFGELMSLSMAIYAPMEYILPSRLSKYEDMYDTDTGRSTLKQKNREKALQRLMTINMLKRLESCVDSFRITLKRLNETNKLTLEQILNYENSKLNSQVVNLNQFNEEFDDEDIELEELSTLGKVKIDFADMDLLLWKSQLIKDIDILNTLYDLMCYITPDKDLKLQKLIEVVDNKVTNPFNPNNQKLLIFSAFADTTNYLYENISKYVFDKYGLKTARIQGGISGNTANVNGSKDTDRLLTLFSPISKEREIVYPDENEVIDVLIATDCISEGQNLQDCDICINYDIHWNPVRIVQRFGRIDRIGSKNSFIQLINFWPNVSLDEYINLNSRVENRMTLVDATGTADDNVLSPEQLELEYRKEQLMKLQGGELQDLEDADSSISITDLGLNEFRMDMISYIKQNGVPNKITTGLYAVVGSNHEAGINAGVIYVLKNRNNEINIGKQNRLHPYYLVYIDEDGTVIENHMSVKKILDIFRCTCKNEEEPIKKLCSIFNAETKNGNKMDKYNNLLSDCVKSIINIKEESEINLLFKKGSDILFNSKIQGLDDFELITFLVIK